MLVVNVELMPGGSPHGRRTLARMEIGNVTDLSDVSSYEIRMLEGANPLTGQPARTCSFRVEDHDRRQSVWALIGTAIANMRNATFAEF